ncbi:PIN-like domain-containing protein [Streptomyces sp. NPDC056399]|uniref:PIN-like domain-containing protein n=1 Tax=Streptomyces sp. NPDC056399 TaxID=3345807 RepID=UPI0035D6A301
MGSVSTFLNSFEGFWRRPKNDYRNAVRGFRVALDTNVLLELYRFTPGARREMLNVLRGIQDRLWVPHHVASEFYGRRTTALKEHLDLYTSTPESLEGEKRKALQSIHTFAKRCSIGDDDKRKLTQPIEEAFALVLSEISRHKDSFDLTLNQVVAEDPVLEELADLLDGRVGEPFEADVIDSMKEEYDRRAKQEVPPGFRDFGKKENAHGDFFLWEQLLREAASSGSSFLLVTNDAKEDWIRRDANLIIGAHPSLIEEYKARCGAGDFLITQLDSFLRIAKEELGAVVSDSTMQQAKNLTTVHADPRDEVFSMSDNLYLDVLSAIEEESSPQSDSKDDRSRAKAMMGLLRKVLAAEVDASGSYQVRLVGNEVGLFEDVWYPVVLSASRRDVNAQTRERVEAARMQIVKAAKYKDIMDLRERVKFLASEIDSGGLGDERRDLMRRALSRHKKELSDLLFEFEDKFMRGGE